jgi:hypothetical protein
MSLVKRPTWILAALVASLALAVPAGAAEGRAVTGVVASISASAVSVQDAKGVVTTCSLASKSPSLAGYSVGERVRMQCVRAKGQLVLARVRALPAASASPTDETRPVTFAGAITALSDTSISLHDGNRDLTCAIDDTSPSTDGFAVGQHAAVACAKGVLAKIATITRPAPSPPPTTTTPTTPPPHKTLGAQGVLTALSSSSVTVHTDGGDVTCTVGANSPALGDFQVGDRVKMACVDGIVVALAKADAAPNTAPPPPPPPPPPATTAGGTITALSSSALTIHNTEHGDVTCSVGPSSPSLGDYHVGDRVGIACVDDTLVKIVRLA